MVRKFRTALLFAAFVLLPAAAWARDGTITGRVTDTTGALLPGVTVTVASPQALGVRTAVTDETGGYRVGLLSPGVYSVKYEHPGFNILERTGIQMSAGFVATLNIALEVATVSQTRISIRRRSPSYPTATTYFPSWR
jgi:hypothetical protein